MVDSILNNFIIKPSAFKSFHNPNNFITNYKYTMFGKEETFIKRKAYEKDNLKISIQAGDGLYSEPRAYSKEYTKYELGFPNFDCEYLKKFAEDKDDLQKTVYGYVPFQYVIYLILEKF